MTDWIEALLPRKSACGSASAIKVAAELAFTDANREVRQARIVLTTDGKLARAARGEVYLPVLVDVEVDVPLVADEVLEDAEARTALNTLGIAEVSAVTVLEALVDRAIADGPTDA